MSANTNEQKLVNAIQELTARLKQEQVKTFKNNIAIKLLTKEISRLKGELIKVKAVPKSTLDFNAILSTVNKSLQSELRLTDDDIRRHTDEWVDRIKNIKPQV